MSRALFRLAPRPSEHLLSDEDHVFRDFESSRIVAIRQAVARDPWRYTPWFLFSIALWTVALSAGAAYNGDWSLAVNLTPHVAHFTMVLGVFFYPLRLVWLPALAYLAVFFFQFHLPFGTAPQWSSLPGMSAQRIAELLMLNLTAAAVIGLICRLALHLMRDRLRPHMLDLWLCAVAFASILVVTMVQMVGMLAIAGSLPAAVREAWGFGEHYITAALRRIARGGVVLSVFLLVAIEHPRRRQIGYSLLVAAVFPALAGLQQLGYVLHPTVDVVVVGIVITLLTPVRVAVAGCTAGIAAYAAMTGHFLDDRVLGDAHEIMLVNYSTLGLVTMNLIFALRSHSAHVLAEKDAAIRKLSRAREFAGVGLFAANQDSRRFRLDEAAQRMIGLPGEGDLGAFLATFDEGGALSDALAAGRGQSSALTLQVTGTGTRRVLRLWVWTERTPSGARAAYGLIIDITEAEEREARLREALGALSLREDRQRQLFSIISHELRTPASVLSLLIDDTPESEDPARRRQLREARDQLMTVLNDMRQTVNPEQNLPIKLQPYTPAELGESVRNAMDLTAKQGGIAIDLVLGAGAQLARMGDVVRVRQALTNLVRNAILHSGGRTVRLECAMAPPEAEGVPVTEWRVEDDGVGLDPDSVERLFEPFVRGKEDVRRRADGSGLGLYIARSSIATLGGTLEHYRPAQGGTGFLIRLPEALTEAPRGGQPAPQGPVRPERDWTVVLAEDNALVAEITKARLERIRGRVRVAVNGREALRLVEEEAPDVVITDLFMPELDGDELARRLRAGGFGGPILGMTAAVVGEEMDRLRLAGVNAVMKKPLDFERLSTFLREGFPDPVAAEDLPGAHPRRGRQAPSG